MFQFNDIEFRYDPYPIGFMRNCLPDAFYSKLTESFPALENLRRAANMGEGKYLLTEFDTPSYFNVLNAAPAWRQLYDYIKSRDFVEQTLAMLLKANIDQGLSELDIVTTNHYDSSVKKCGEKVVRKFKQLPMPGNRFSTEGHLTSRFEFSALQGQVASHLPHTDAPRKVISMVISMMKEGEWNPDWGGGTAVCKPKDMRRSFNYMNRYLEFDDVDVLDTYPFIPNGCVVFVKTFNSWHTVMPYTAPLSIVRKSIVINIDCPQALGAQQRG